MSQVSHPVGGNGTDLNGVCPPPFLDPTKFTSGGGHINGRFCAKIALLPGDPTCCLPCPATDWLFPNSFSTWYTVSEVIAAVGLVMCAFLMLSWAFLPPNLTRRHYLSVCLTVGIMLVNLSFVVPLGTKPRQCYDEITPNDMYTNLTCAWSGAFVVAGGLVVPVWTFIRTLSMHLQICWDIVPGQRFFYIAQGIGWGVASILFCVTLTITGVSFRFGETCHVNPNNSMADFWGPLLGVSVAAAVIQILTFCYCIKVYLKNVFSDSPTPSEGTGLPSYHSSSIRTASARAVYQRVKKVLWLQWRSITIVLFVLVDIIFFAIVWVKMDNSLESAKGSNIEQFLPFLLCLVSNGAAHRDKCFHLGQDAVTNESTAIAILMLLSLVGIQCALLMIRKAMFTGWYDLARSKLRPNREFVSLDARAEQKEGGSRFELMKVAHSPPTDDEENKTDYDRKIDTPSTMGRGVTPPARMASQTERPYRQHVKSFSGPRPPSRAGHGGGGLHGGAFGGMNTYTATVEGGRADRPTQWASQSHGAAHNPYDWRTG